MLQGPVCSPKRQALPLRLHCPTTQSVPGVPTTQAAPAALTCGDAEEDGVHAAFPCPGPTGHFADVVRHRAADEAGVHALHETVLQIAGRVLRSGGSHPLNRRCNAPRPHLRRGGLRRLWLHPQVWAHAYITNCFGAASNGPQFGLFRLIQKRVQKKCTSVPRDTSRPVPLRGRGWSATRLDVARSACVILRSGVSGCPAPESGPSGYRSGYQRGGGADSQQLHTHLHHRRRFLFPGGPPLAPEQIAYGEAFSEVQVQGERGDGGRKDDRGSMRSHYQYHRAGRRCRAGTTTGGGGGAIGSAKTHSHTAHGCQTPAEEGARSHRSSK